MSFRHVQQFKYHLLPRARSKSSRPKLLLSDSLGHTCYLELARGTTYTLHVSPPRDGGPRAVPVVLKGPPMSFYHLVSYILSWQGQVFFSTLVNFRGRHVVLCPSFPPRAPPRHKDPR
jgi:hypothetical protein